MGLISWVRSLSNSKPRGGDSDGPKLAKASAAAIAARRKLVPGLPLEPGALGLALSGGGIRSATISLGVLQALAAKGRLLDFDYVSTVSGGGYAGSFLTSLFLPAKARGLDGKAQVSSTGAGDTKFALDALTLDACQSTMAAGNGHKIRSPVWWLREHSRYLAPNGASDYASAATYLVRAWLAMVYVFVLPLFVALLLINRASVFAFDVLPGAAWSTAKNLLTLGGTNSSLQVSPLAFLAAFLLFLSVSTGAAYWQTEWLPRYIERRRLPFGLGLRSPKFLYALIVMGSLGAVLGIGYAYRAELATVLAGTASFPITFLGWTFALALASQLIGLDLLARHLTMPTHDFTAGFRSAVTRRGTTFNLAFVAVTCLALIDTLALALQRPSTGWFDRVYTVLTGTLVPAIAWLINWLTKRADSAGGTRRALARFMNPLALLLGITLYAALAVSVDVLMYKLVYPGGYAFDPAHMIPANLPLIGTLAIVLLLMTGASTGFINLSSVHSLYASRLTRAYLGATNVERLEEVAAEDRDRPITQTHVNDDAEISIYQRQRTAAPLHLINVTLNETRNRESSQIIERDRKGVPIVFGPEGVLVDAARSERAGRRFFHDWDELQRRKVEKLTVGQLCAISGAAASSGMGANTSLGLSLITTFANIRLGYWWWAGDLFNKPVELVSEPVRWFYLQSTAVLRTYFYLFNEMAARYSRDYARLYLSDGGHFENSAVYELLRRGVKGILVLDNGADPDFGFADLENLVRKARIDLGLSVNVATPGDVTQLCGRKGTDLFFNMAGEEWRKAALRRGGAAIALLLNVYRPCDRPAEGSSKSHPIYQRIIWLKPKRVEDLPPDIDGYAGANEMFPQQSTGDQFFTEAQWESYRGLGYSYILALFERTSRKQNILRRLVPQPAAITREARPSRQR